MTVEWTLATVLVLLWFLLLLGGTVVDTAPYREALAPAKGHLPRTVSLGTSLWYWFVTATCYTVSNVLLLTVFSGMLGGISRSFRPPSPLRRGEQLPSLGNTVVAGALQGFFAYVLIIAGFLFAMGDQFLATTPPQYLRLAGLASALSFLFGYDRSTFGRILGAVRTRLLSSPDEDNAKAKPHGDAVAKGPTPTPVQAHPELPVDVDKPPAIDAAARDGSKART